MGGKNVLTPVLTVVGAVVGGVLTWYVGGSGAGAGAAAGASLSNIIMGAGVGAMVGGAAGQAIQPQRSPLMTMQGSYNYTRDEFQPTKVNMDATANAALNPADAFSLKGTPDLFDQSGGNYNQKAQQALLATGSPDIQDPKTPASPILSEEQKERRRRMYAKKQEDTASLLGSSSTGEALL